MLGPLVIFLQMDNVISQLPSDLYLQIKAMHSFNPVRA